MKRMVNILVLSCALAGTSMAGEIPMVGNVSAPTPPITPTSALGDIPSVGSSYEFTDAALDLIQMLIGVGI